MLKRRVDVAKCLTYAFVPLSLLYLLIGYNQGLNVYDEGLSVYGAVSVLHGDVLYRDFFTGYGPAQFYVMAVLFKLFGITLIVERLASVCFMWLMCFSGFLVARRLVSAPFALLAWVLMVVQNIGIVPGFPPPMPNIMLFSFLGCLCMFRFIATRRARWVVFSGLCSGLVAVFRHDFAVYSLLAGLFVSAVFVAACYYPEGTRIHRRLLAAAGIQAVYLLSAAAVVVPAAALVLSRVSSQDVVFPLAVVPLKLYARYFALPYPMPPDPRNLLNGSMALPSFMLTLLSRVPFWMPIFVFGATTAFFANLDWRSDTRRQLERWLPAVLVFLLGVEYWNYLRIRSDLPHALPTYTVSTIVLAVLMQNIRASGRLRKPLYAVAALVSLSIVALPVRAKIPMVRSLVEPNGFTFTLERGRGIYPGDQYAEYENAVRYVQERTEPTERIFVGSARHDMLRTNDVMFYVLAERMSATRYVELHRAVACAAPCQKEIVRDMKAMNVRYVVLRHDHFRELPNESSRSSGVTILDDFIRDRYSVVAVYGDYSILHRKRGATAHRS